MNFRVKRLVIIGLAIAAMVTFFMPQAVLAEDKVLRIGTIGPFTGPAARVGEEFKGAIKMAFDAIGNKIGDYKVEIFYVDCESDAEKSAKAYEKAIVRDKIDVGFNTWHSWVSASCMDVAAKYKVPHFFSFGAGKVIVDKYKSDPAKYKYWVGKTWPVAEKLSIGYIKALDEAIAKGLWKPKAKKVAVYGVDNDWGRNFGAAVKDQFTKAGWEVVMEEYARLGETEFYPLLSKIKRQDVAVAVGTMSDPPSVSAFIKQSKEVGLNSVIISDGLGWVGEWYKLTGDASDYVLDQIPQWTTPEAKKFRDDFKAKYGFEPGASSGGLCYDTVNFFIKVLKTTLEKYGTLNKENFMKCGEELVMTGKLTHKGLLIKEWKYTPETFPDPVVDTDYYSFPVIQYFKGQAEIVWPDSFKTKDIQFPESMKK
ncbi:MAG: ABC transporter substrate-binding protein [Deltaproteobacteria bacterium]|nr:ABC transporter substrate-binding protein [Deltaproteobacteria bacterium]